MTLKVVIYDEGDLACLLTCMNAIIPTGEPEHVARYCKLAERLTNTLMVENRAHYDRLTDAGEIRTLREIKALRPRVQQKEKVT